MQLRNISLRHISVPILLGLSLGFSQKASAADLGLAGNYNLFATGDVSENADIEGALAAGGSVNLSSFSVGGSLSSSQISSIGGNVLVAGDNVTLTNGQVNGGNVVLGGTYSGNGVGIPNGSVIEGTPINFSAIGASLVSLSANLSALTPIETVTTGGEITLNGTGSLEVFDVYGSALSSASSFTIKANNANTDATVVVNVSGTSDSLGNFQFYIDGTNEEDVLFNFYQATNLTASGITIYGSVLAPQAAFSFPNGAVEGNVVVASYTGPGQIDEDPFQGNLPSSVPEPSPFLGSLVAVGFGIALRFRKQFRAR